MQEALVLSSDLYKNRFVVMEVGVYRSLLNHLQIPKEMNPLYIGVDIDKNSLNFQPTEHAPESQPMHADITSSKFLNDKKFDGNIDRFIAFNVLSNLPHNEVVVPKIIAKIGALLKPGGQAIIVEFQTPQDAETLLKLDVSKYGLRAETTSDQERAQKMLSSLHLSSAKTNQILTRLKPKENGHREPFITVLTRV